MTKFSGDVMKFESFWGMFSICIDNAPVTPEYKKAVLLTKLEGEALICVSAKKDYNNMREALLQRYRNPLVKRNHYFSLFQKIPPIKNDTDLPALQNLLQTTESIMMDLDDRLNEITTLDAIKSLVMERLPPVVAHKVRLTHFQPEKDIRSAIDVMEQQIMFLNAKTLNNIRYIYM